MVADLDALGLLVKVEPHEHNVGTHDRCKTTVEPMSKPQWFVKMEETGKPAIEAVKRTEIRSLYRLVLTRPIFTGWRTSVTGVFPDSSGGDIRFRHITVTTAARWSLPRKALQLSEVWKHDAVTGSRYT